MDYIDLPGADAKVPAILMVTRMPMRLSVEDTAVLVACRDTDSIGVLVRHNMLDPLGDPTPGQPLWFSTAQILALAQNAKWLSKATKILRDHVRKKNKKAEASRNSKKGNK